MGSCIENDNINEMMDGEEAQDLQMTYGGKTGEIIDGDKSHEMAQGQKTHEMTFEKKTHPETESMIFGQI
jgi:hypothetical protein